MYHCCPHTLLDLHNTMGAQQYERKNILHSLYLYILRVIL